MLKKKKLRTPRNKFEAKLLDQCADTGIKFEYETEKFPYVRKFTYTPDIILHTKLGKVYIEAKGYFRPEHKAKMIAVKQQHPELDIRLVFYSNNKKNTTWAEKNGFKYAIHSIPDIWFKGLW